MLIEKFNEFSETANRQGLKAAERSLYYGLLSEFNKARYPRQLVLKNAYVQQISGITSSSTFAKARDTLINAGIIAYDKDTYELLPLANSAVLSSTAQPLGKNHVKVVENPCKSHGKVVEKSCKNPKSSTMPKLILLKKEKEEEEDAPATTAQVMETWESCEGAEPNYGVKLGLYDLVKEYGSNAVIQGIIAASQANSRPRLSFNFVKAVVARQNGDQNGKHHPDTNKYTAYGGDDVCLG